MKKRIAAIVLAALCVLGCLTSCHDRKINDDDIKGAEIKLYVNELCYELDPALCLNNDSALQICGLLYDTLFTLDENGKIQKSLVKSYTVNKDEKNDEYTMQLTLRDDTSWSDGIYVSAEDVIFAWKRILDPSFNSEAACLLYDIKNAKEAKAGDCSIDDVGIYAVDELVLQITFCEDIQDYDAFLLNLTSIALAPLRELVVASNGDWSKKPASTVCSGPFMIRRINYGLDTANNPDPTYTSLILERNPNYRRTKDAKHVDTSVKPFRLVVDYFKTKEEMLQSYAGEDDKERVFFIGDIALSQRQAYKDTAAVSDLLSTHTYYLNENAEIKKADGTTEKLFADKNVRLALSACIDRQAIADAVVFAKAAEGFVPNGIFEANSAKSTFRANSEALISASADLSAAQNFIAQSGITPADYSFSVMVRAEDEVHVCIAEKVVEAWKALGFNVTLNTVTPTINDEKLSGEDVKDIFDDIFSEMFYANNYEVIAVDVLAKNPTALSFLAPFATGYSGQGQDMSSDVILSATPHGTGYESEAYTAKIDAVYAAKSAAEKAPLLHEAEKLLCEDMPVIPILFNQQATLTHKDLTGIETTYYGYHVFTKASLKNWISYIETTVDEEETTAP